MNASKSLEDLQQWYHAQCDGYREHYFGIEIGTTDNPGWFLKVDLTDTILEDRPFGGVEYGCADADDVSLDWISCKVDGAQFLGYGGPRKLPDLIQVFLALAKSEDDWLAVPPEMSQ